MHVPLLLPILMSSHSHPFVTTSPWEHIVRYKVWFTMLIIIHTMTCDWVVVDPLSTACWLSMLTSVGVLLSDDWCLQLAMYDSVLWCDHSFITDITDTSSSPITNNGVPFSSYSISRLFVVSATTTFPVRSSTVTPREWFWAGLSTDHRDSSRPVMTSFRQMSP